MLFGRLRRLHPRAVFHCSRLATLPTANRRGLTLHQGIHRGQGNALPLGMVQLPRTRSAKQDSAIVRRMKERRIDNP